MSQANRSIKMQKVKSLLCSIAALMIISTHMINVSARYVPYTFNRQQQLINNGDDPTIISRRQDVDDDDDEMDSNASAPYQNQDDGTGGNNGDGYDDSEADGPYEETPREQEGQADLERFFDDHLGASERDGMDKENLPSNHVPLALLPSGQQIASKTLDSLPTIQTRYLHLPDEKLIITQQITQKTKDTTDNQLPDSLANANNDNKRQITLPANQSDISRQKNLSMSVPPPISIKNDNYQTQSINLVPRGPEIALIRDYNLTANDSQHIVATENDDFDRVYVTDATNKPFRIDDLGGFDPEQDFKDASMDFNDQRSRRFVDGLYRSVSDWRPNDDEQLKRNGNDQGSGADKKDDVDSMFEGASETDEITFGQDDPFQTDLEAEMRQQAFDKVNVFGADGLVRPAAKSIQATDTKSAYHHDHSLAHGPSSKVQRSDEYDDNDDHYKDENDDSNQQPQESLNSEQRQQGGFKLLPSVPIKSTSRHKDTDNDDGDIDDEGGWAHDGVEDMEVPTQDRQDHILERASKQDRLMAKQRQKNLSDDTNNESLASNEQPQTADSQNNNGDGDNNDNVEEQRMPNGNYLDEYLT